MTDTTAITARWTDHVKEARKLLGGKLPAEENILIAGIVRRKPSGLARFAGAQGLYNRFLVLTEKRLFLLKGNLRLDQVEHDIPVSDMRSVRFEKDVLRLVTMGEQLDLQFLKIWRGAELARDLLLCLKALGVS